MKILRAATKRMIGCRRWRIREGVDLVARGNWWRSSKTQWYVWINDLPMVRVTERVNVQSLLVCALGCPSCKQIPHLDQDIYGPAWSIHCPNCYDADDEGQNWAHGAGRTPLDAYDSLCEMWEMERGE